MTPVSLPQFVSFPVTVTSISYRPGDTVKKHALLLKFKYWDYQEDPSSNDANPQKIRVERFGTLESPVEGRIVNVNTAIDKEIPHSGIELFHIKEPCAHTVQYGGLCALCGKSVEDEKDYTGFRYEDRATIAMSHDNTGLRISLDEATKIEQITTKRLGEERKLILVVDLDQTVIQATVDPNVGKWQLNPKDPNYPYVADVRSFYLEEEPVLPRGWTGPKPPPTRCCYYVKLRPGLETYLARVSKLYELHIYTMATRSYALAISKIIDPTGEYFSDRILSRDESGLITHKNLKRLFPVDQSMVAIIDDRSDVWQWQANLVKVVPYEFFVGIGDINLTFSPKNSGQLLGPSKKRRLVACPEAAAEKSATDEVLNGISNDDAKEEQGEQQSDTASRSLPSGTDSVPSSPIDHMVLLKNDSLLVKQKNRSKLVELQKNDRPLAKLQRDLDRATHSDHEGSPASDGNDDSNILSEDDHELKYLESALARCHGEYYRLYDAYRSQPGLERPDLTHIIPKLKRECLQGIVILFSGVFALGKNIDDVEIVIWCRQFGVRVVTEVYPAVTHVVCRDTNSAAFKTGLTLKVRIAKKTLPHVKIVNPDWVFSCLSQWKEVPTDEYEIRVSDRDWYVSDGEVQQYLNALESQAAALRSRPASNNRSDSRGSIEDFDLNDASEEVDDFLAGISDDSGSDDSESVHAPAATSFVKSIYGAKRKAENDDGAARKKLKDDDSDFDELEQELLNELDRCTY